jgi:hypothetical protein
MDPKKVMNDARKYVADNLVNCARDFQQLKQTGILPCGFFTGAIDIIRPIGLRDSMKIAESVLIEAMLDEIADR